MRSIVRGEAGGGSILKLSSEERGFSRELVNRMMEEEARLCLLQQ